MCYKPDRKVHIYTKNLKLIITIVIVLLSSSLTYSQTNENKIIPKQMDLIGKWLAIPFLSISDSTDLMLIEDISSIYSGIIIFNNDGTGRLSTTEDPANITAFVWEYDEQLGTILLSYIHYQSNSYARVINSSILLIVERDDEGQISIGIFKKE